MGRKEERRLATRGRRMIDVFVTVHSNLAYQQHLIGLPFAVVVLTAPSNRLADLSQLMPDVVTALVTIRPGQIVRVGG